MVGIPVRHHDRRGVGTREWITYFQIILARSRYLPGSPPDRGWVVAERIVHPFIDFVGEDGRVRDCRSKKPGGVEVPRRVRLNREPGRAVVAENTAGVYVRHGRSQYRVVEEEDREVARIDARQIRNNLRRQNEVKVVDVDDP